MRGCLYFFRKFESYFDASCWLSRQKVLKTASQPFYSKKHHFPSERLNFFPRHCSPQHYFASFDFFLIFRLFEHFSFLAFTFDFWILIFFSLTWTFQLFGVFIGASEAIGDSVAEFVDLEDLENFGSFIHLAAKEALLKVHKENFFSSSSGELWVHSSPC